MALGRASGKNRVEKAIIDALDSPLLYGNDIGKAKRILFNIYASEEHPIFVSEMQEIDDFFDQLDPNIDVIWGTSTDDSLGEDAKVTILATGLEDDLRNEVQKNVHRNDDDFYEDLILRLYKPVTNKKVGEVITQGELEFEVEPAPEVEPASQEVDSESTTTEADLDIAVDDDEWNTEEEAPVSPTMVSKWRAWLKDFMNDVKE